MYEIKLSDGTTLSNLKLNGNNFITEQEINTETFRGKLSSVTITGDEADAYGLVGTHKNMELLQVKKYGSEFWFILRDTPEEKIKLLTIEGNIDYLAIMTGVTL